MYLLNDDCVFHSRVSPFGVLGVMAFCELSLVFVHLRPSSSSCAKASTWRPFFLDWKYCLLFDFLLNFLGLRPATISWSHDGETYLVLHQPDRLALSSKSLILNHFRISTFGANDKMTLVLVVLLFSSVKWFKYFQIVKT